MLHHAAGTPPVSEAIGSLYAQLDEQVAQHGPTCWTSGRCCNFDAFGHRLYVTALEIAWVLSQANPLPPVDPNGSCPFQTDQLCGVHTIRPMGCRVFFCQKTDDPWQGPLYECFILKLRLLHEQFDLPYLYLEWRTGLNQAMQTR